MKRRILIFGTAVALYVVLMSVVWNICTRQARVKTEWLLDYEISDVHDTVAGAIDTILHHVVRTAIRRIGSARAMPIHSLEEIAEEFDVDEINVVNREGRIIASNDPSSIGVVMAGDPVMGDFMVLTNGVTPTVAQPFRPSTRRSEFRAKYLAAAFPGGDGFVQIGLDEQRLARMLPAILGYIFYDWCFGRTGFFLCAANGSDQLISNSDYHHDEARTFAEAGYDVAAAAQYEFVADGKTSGKTFVQTLFGEKCYCRVFLYGGHRFVAALPEREYYDTRTIFGFSLGTILLVLLAIFAFFVDRLFRDADRIKSYYTAEDDRRAKDMSIAASIQESAMPRMFPPYPEERRMDIFASMHTARDVGGDFYDFFFTSPAKFVFLVADVSGKGVSAALFMMRAKATINGIARTGVPLEEVVAGANDALSRDNDASMFVTVWIGELDLKSGVLKYVNAGHNPPLVVRGADGRPSTEPQFVREHSGLMLGAMPGIKYCSHTVRLVPGDMIYLYTDGITEQPDANRTLFGEERLEFSLDAMLSAGTKAIAGGSSPLLVALFAAVVAHGAGTEQADDCTQLLVRYNGTKQSRSFPATREGLAAVSEWLDSAVKAPQDKMSSLHIILDEICSNVVRYSKATAFEVVVELTDEPHGVQMTFIDDGVAYNPLSHDDPDTTLEADKRPIGGLGIMIVKKMASSVSYSRDGDRNRFTVRCAWECSVG